LKRQIVSLILMGMFAVMLAGCGDSPGTQANPESGKTAGPPPRPGEDVMKEQMQLLQKKGMLSKVPGLPKNK
jgi:hypothetical protein